MSLPMMAITAKELDLRGSFRFHEEFATGIALMRKGLIDVKPLITHTVPLDRCDFGLRDRHRPQQGDEGADRVPRGGLSVS